ncbi:MAG: hypothetical protein MJA83_19080 [Gammaproteobacteria bacterium]|nr:hypothetical protein [Gammaproteobacteria bacterium]
MGKISYETSQEDLKDLYGADNVLESDIYIGEGFTKPGAVLFPDDPAKKLEIVWQDETRSSPDYVIIRKEATAWKTKQGIGIDTELKEIERLNGGIFSLLGFGWDYSGTVDNYNGGKLQAFKEQGLILRLFPAGEKRHTPEYSQVSGDWVFKSDMSAMQKLNPTVHQMVVDIRKSEDL